MDVGIVDNANKALLGIPNHTWIRDRVALSVALSKMRMYVNHSVQWIAKTRA